MASLSQVFAMSVRMACTLKFGSPSAIRRHCAACSLHSTGLITHSPATSLEGLSKSFCSLLDDKLNFCRGRGILVTSGDVSAPPWSGQKGGESPQLVDSEHFRPAPRTCPS